MEDACVTAVVPLAAVPAHARTVDLGGGLLAPGFIDLQVNGGGGALLNTDTSAQAIRTIALAHRAFGTTSLLPTLISASLPEMLAAIAATEAAMLDASLGVLGLHLEGPYLNPEKSGVHAKARTRRASLDDVAALLAKPTRAVALMTAAPEMLEPGVLAALRARGWRLAIGHSNASYAQAMQALAEGFCGHTHLFNAMSAFTGREPGVVGAAFAHESAFASVIVDGHHVAYASVAIAKQVMGERLFLVTDAMPPVGSDMDHFTLGPYAVRRVGDRLATPDGTLAGACLDMATAVRNCVAHVGIALPEALRMAALYPARAIGQAEQYGRVAAGFHADFCVLDAQQRVLATVKGGEFTQHLARQAFF